LSSISRIPSSRVSLLFLPRPFKKLFNEASPVDTAQALRQDFFPVESGAVVDYAILAQHAVIEEGAQVIGEESQITVIPEGETVSVASTEQRVG